MADWRTVTAIEAIRFAASRTLDEAATGNDYEAVVRFTDGAALRLTAHDGIVYSEYTSDPATVVIEVKD